MKASPLPPAVRLFACELANAVSAPLSGIFIVGALTDVSAGALRISDPTGVFSVKINRNNAALCRAAEKLEAPCFAAVYAGVRAQTYAGKTFYEVTAESVSETTRDARDAWICEAAKGAGERLAEYPKKAALLEEIRGALNAVKPATAAAANISDEQIFAVIEELSEKKGAPIVSVLEALKKLGMTEQDAKTRLNKLAEDGDLYSPTKETIKVL